MFLSWSIIVNRLPENRLQQFTQCLIRSLYFFFFYLSLFLSVSRHTAIRWWASMIISDEIEVATIVNQRWNENIRNYSNYRIAIPIKFGNREWCDDDKGICHKVWNVQNFCWVCFLKLFPFYFLVSFVVVVVVRANPNPKTHDLMENASRQKQRLDEKIIINTSEAELKWRISGIQVTDISFVFILALVDFIWVERDRPFIFLPRFPEYRSF